MALAFYVGAQVRTRVYVDCFNLYYGAVKGTQFKWLDPVQLSRLLLPQGCTVDKLLYFTAHVSGIPDPGAPARQHTYLSALRTLAEVEVHFGSFLAKTVWRPLVNLPVADRRIDAPINTMRISRATPRRPRRPKWPAASALPSCR